MYNIKLKSVPNKAKTGSQLDYSLVDRNTLFLKPNTPVDSDVKNTMGAVPRDKANIEAEGGETVIGDINNDGYLEHQTIVGKRHSQGGVPLNVPEGSFIFSDTKKMTIKDPEVLGIFGMKPSKAGYTPAEIAKKYNVNDYINILKDPAKDKYAKETAQIMLQSNLKKLGMLALIQESMKGFPDGVPAIAESIMGQMQGGQEQEEMQEAPEEQYPQEEMQEGEQPMQRFGGTQLPKAQVGKNKREDDYSPWGDIKRSFNANVDNISKKGLMTHLGEWWNEKEETDAYKQRGAKQKQLDLQNAQAERQRAQLERQRVEKEKQRVEAARLKEITNTRKLKKAEQDKQAYLKDHKFTGETVYFHNQPFTVGTADPSRLSSIFSQDDSHVFPVKGFNEDGEEQTKYMSKNELYEVLNKAPNTTPYVTSSRANPWDKLQSKPLITERALNKNLTIKTGDDLIVGENTYKVVNPWGEKSINYKSSFKSLRDIFDDTQGIIHVKNKDGEDEFLEGEDIKDAYSLDPNLISVKRGNIYQPKNKAASDVNNASTSAPAPIEETQRDTVVQQGTPVQEASAAAAARRNVAETANANAQRAQQERAAQPAEQPRYKVRIKKPPVQNATQNAAPSLGTINGVPIETTDEFAYGGGVHQYKFQGDVGGSTVTAPQTPVQPGPEPERKIVKYLWSTKQNKMFAIDEKGGHFETPYTKIITQEKEYDPKEKKIVPKYYGKFPDDMSSKDRAAISASINPSSNIGVVHQHSNQRIDPKNPYTRFYANTRPQDYEDRIVRVNLGDQATDAMDEITKRKKAFEYLGIKDVADTDLKDAARLYNDPYFFDKQFMPAFHSKLPEGTFRPQFRSNGQIGIEYLKGYAASEKPGEAKKDEAIKTSDAVKPYIAPQYANQGPWIQDLINYAGTATDNTNTYLPNMSSHPYMTHGYVLNDPTTAIRGIQQGVNSLQDNAFNSMSGNVALAASSGIAGQGMDKAAEVAGNVNNANVGIVNNAAASNIGILNRGIDANELDKSTWNANMSTALDNRDKEISQQKWRQIGAMNNLYTNWQKKNQYEQMFKNVTINPVTGQRTIHGNDRAILNDDGTLGYDPYVSPYASGAAAIDTDSLMDYYMKTKGMPFEEAKSRAELQLKGHAIKNSRRGASPQGYGYGSQGAVPYGYGASAGSAYGYDQES